MKSMRNEFGWKNNIIVAKYGNASYFLMVDYLFPKWSDFVMLLDWSATSLISKCVFHQCFDNVPEPQMFFSWNTMWRSFLFLWQKSSGFVEQWTNLGVADPFICLSFWIMSGLPSFSCWILNDPLVITKVRVKEPIGVVDGPDGRNKTQNNIIKKNRVSICKDSYRFFLLRFESEREGFTKGKECVDFRKYTADVGTLPTNIKIHVLCDC